MVKTKKTIRVGFDLDGVILSNPSRILRGLIARSKKAHLFPRQELEFYHPNSAIERWLWLMVHKSSFRLAAGFAELEQLCARGDLELYVVSARFSCLQPDTKRWIQVINRNGIFKKLYFNDQDEQPHLFKERMLRQLQLDYFVEDNFDLVSYLSSTQQQTEVWWISNFIDRQLTYPHKFFSLRQVVTHLRNLL
jgi:hypothetical protein